MMRNERTQEGKNYGVKNRGRMLGGFIICLCIFSLLWIAYAQQTSKEQLPVAKRGVFHVTSLDFAEKGPVRLDGEWEFYEGLLLDPADFREGIDPADRLYLDVPGTWKGREDGEGVDRKGSGTYRLKVLTDDPGLELGLKVYSIRMAHRLFVNGKLAGEMGFPSDDPASYGPENTPYTTFFAAGGKEIEIIIQTANHTFVTGGIVNSVRLGLQEDIVKLDMMQTGVDIGIIMLMVLSGVFQLVFYFLNQRTKVFFLCGMCMLFMAVGYSVYNEKIVQRTLPELSFEVVYKLLDVSQVFSTVFIFLFLCAVEPRLMPGRQVKLALAPLLLYGAVVVILPYETFIEIKYILILYLAALTGVGLLKMFLLARSDRTAGGAEGCTGQVLVFGGLFSLIAYFAVSTLYSENLMTSDGLGKCGAVGFTVLMQIVLAVRFAGTHRQRAEGKMVVQQAQIKPHFLYNALSSVISFCYTDGEKAAHLLTRLSQYLRYILDRDGSEVYVPLGRELELVKAYIEIEQARFGERLAFHCEVDEGLERERIPILSIQPFIENAVQHGLFEKEEQGLVLLLVHRERGHMRVTVEDDGVGFDEGRLERIGVEKTAGEGMGIQDIKKRLGAVPGATLSIHSKPGIGTRIVIRFPIGAKGE